MARRTNVLRALFFFIPLSSFSVLLNFLDPSLLGIEGQTGLLLTLLLLRSFFSPMDPRQFQEEVGQNVEKNKETKEKKWFRGFSGSSFIFLFLLSARSNFSSYRIPHFFTYQRENVSPSSALTNSNNQKKKKKPSSLQPVVQPQLFLPKGSMFAFQCCCMLLCNTFWPEAPTVNM